ncbi:MAG: GNAT family N-acetyltransferase [Chloroflexota bacterium]
MTTIRESTADELPLFDMMEIEAGREFITGYDLAKHIETFNDPCVTYFSIEHQADLVGFIILAHPLDDDSVEFRRIVVTKKGEGIGQAAIKAMETFCRTQLNRKWIWLDVFEDNARARYLYQKLGFVQFDQTAYEGRPLLYYEKWLS